MAYFLDLQFLRATAYAKRAYAIAIPSVCHTGDSCKKRLKLGSCDFHHTVAPSF